MQQPGEEHGLWKLITLGNTQYSFAAYNSHTKGAMNNTVANHKTMYERRRI